MVKLVNNKKQEANIPIAEGNDMNNDSKIDTKNTGTYDKYKMKFVVHGLSYQHLYR